jgi:hypothetical protein
MPRYKTVNEATARALAQQWDQAYGIKVDVEVKPEFCEVIWPGRLGETHPM